MSHIDYSSATRQAIVHLDVGGTPFKILRQTVHNFPDSLVAKVLSDCPHSGQEHQPVYIDRSPKMFQWILEVYRGGDYENTLPKKKADILQRELDFYQLPSLEQLGLRGACRVRSLSAEAMANALLHEIVDEIFESGLQDLFPWYVIIYHKITGDGSFSKRRIFVRPIGFNKTCRHLKFIQERDHGAFLMAMNSQTHENEEEEKTRINMRSSQDDTAFTLPLATEDYIDGLANEAHKLGLIIQPDQLRFRRSSGYLAPFSVLHMRPGRHETAVTIPEFHCSSDE